MPRPRVNSRVRDLPDIALLATTGPIDGDGLRLAIEKTFQFRATHPVPSTILAPPDIWEAPYARMATTDELPWQTLRQLTKAVASFLDPALGADERLTWDPDEWRWRR
jgi:hypothetical protein